MRLPRVKGMWAGACRPSPVTDEGQAVHISLWVDGTSQTMRTITVLPHKTGAEGLLRTL